MLPRGKCIWGCGRSNFNREHVVGQQISKALGIEPPLYMHVGSMTSPAGNSLEIVLKNRVCETCNRGWMRKTDNLMMQFMRPAFERGDAVNLNLSQQKILARWATKVALLLEVYLDDNYADAAGGMPRYVPADNLMALYRRQEPPKRTRVWLGAIESHAVFSSIGSVLATEGEVVPPYLDVARRERGYLLMFNLGKLLFRVVGWELAWSQEPPVLPDPNEAVPDAMHLIHPATSSVRWPPKRRASSNKEVRLLAQADPSW